MSTKTELFKKVFITFNFLLILLLLIGLGCMKKNKIVLIRGLIKPTASSSLEDQLEKELKEFAFKEGLSLKKKPKIEDESVTATFSSNLTCVFNLKKELTSQLASLQFILWRSKIEGKIPSKIDLRFDNPVIRY